MTFPATQFYSEKASKKRVFYTGSDNLLHGYALCYDRDRGTATAVDKNRTCYAEKPAEGNLANFAGLVYGNYTVPSGGAWVDVVQPTGVVMQGYTDQSCTQETTILTVQAGSYALGGIGEGPIVGHALQTVDRSSTNGQVQMYLQVANELSSVFGSSALWSDCPLAAARLDPSIGYEFFDDFYELITGNAWIITNATAGTAAVGSGAGGLAVLDSASSTADQGVQMQVAPGVAFLPAAGKDIWFETKLRVTDLVTDAQLFAGLAIVDTTVIASGENSTANHIGFEAGATIIGTNPGELFFYGEKAGTRGSVASVVTLAETTFVNLGFRVRGVTSVEVYVDGVLDSSTIATANIPVVGLTPTFVCQSEGSSDPILEVDWVRAFQLR